MENNSPTRSFSTQIRNTLAEISFIESLLYVIF
jgi:hypothetical protein